jgi:hypothetical protein
VFSWINRSKWVCIRNSHCKWIRNASCCKLTVIHNEYYLGWTVLSQLMLKEEEYKWVSYFGKHMMFYHSVSIWIWTVIVISLSLYHIWFQAHYSGVCILISACYFLATTFLYWFCIRIEIHHQKVSVVSFCFRIKFSNG